jgi:hypothetical protein
MMLCSNLSIWLMMLCCLPNNGTAKKGARGRNRGTERYTCFSYIHTPSSLLSLEESGELEEGVDANYALEGRPLLFLFRRQ